MCNADLLGLENNRLDIFRNSVGITLILEEWLIVKIKIPTMKMEFF